MYQLVRLESCGRTEGKAAAESGTLDLGVTYAEQIRLLAASLSSGDAICGDT